MENLERGKFEDEFKKAFEGAGMTPSNSLWQSIDSQMEANAGFDLKWKKAFDGAGLTPTPEVWQTIDVNLIQAENLIMRTRVVFYKRLAAASIAVLLTFSGYFYLSNSNSESIKQRDEASLRNIKSIKSQDASTSNKGNELEKASSNVSDENSPNSADATFKTRGQQFETLNNNSNSSIATFSSSNSGYITPIADEVSALTKYSNKVTIPESPLPAIRLFEIEKLRKIYSPGLSMAYLIADITPNARKKNVFRGESNWALTGFTTGLMNGAVGGNQLNNATNDRSSFGIQNTYVSSQTEKIKTANTSSFLAGFGKRIFKRWIFQGNVGYVQQNITSSVSSVLVAPAATQKSPTFSAVSTNLVTYSDNDEIKAQNQFLCIPIQMGYMVIDRKLGLQMNAGVSPDFFLKSNAYSTNNQNWVSNNQLFDKVSLAGMGGIELSYRFMNHYRVSLAPGFRYSITSVYKESSQMSAKPIVADLGVRVRYVF